MFLAQKAHMTELEKPALIMRAAGGLGNQMFQYAAGLGIAQRVGARLLIDTADYRLAGPRSFQLDQMRVPLRVATEVDVRVVMPPYPHHATLIGKLVFRLRYRREMRDRLYREQAFHFEERAFLVRPPIIMDGYFVSPEYFRGIEQDIRSQFQLRNPLSPGNAAIQDEINSQYSVAVHLRRGDYVRDQGVNGVHGVCSDAYYRRAMTIMNASVPAKPRFFVFSDDPEAAKQFSAHYSDCVPVAGDQDRAWEQLHLMARCRSQIIANSTFSWWAAWLNSDPDKIVIAPREWFRKDILRTGRSPVDLFPAEWITIGSE